MGDGASYSIAHIGDLDVAAIGPLSPDDGSPRWQMYVATSDVDAATERVAPAGGTVIAGPHDVFDAGRMTVVADPAGAVFQLWQANEHIGARLVNEHGAFMWSELLIESPESVAPFYETVTGLRLISADPGDGSSYSGFTTDGTMATMVAGSIPPPMPGMPAAWIVYFGADDVDALADRCVVLGGSVMAPPMDIPVGRIAVLNDPQGALFCVFKG